MNKVEAMKIIKEELSIFRAKSYLELKKIIESEPITKEITSETNTKYQIEIVAHWDDKAEENIRVVGCIDDMGWRAYFPLSSDFIISPEGSFIGE